MFSLDTGMDTGRPEQSGDGRDLRRLFIYADSVGRWVFLNIIVSGSKKKSMN